jgi:hypothetical protein
VTPDLSPEDIAFLDREARIARAERDATKALAEWRAGREPGSLAPMLDAECVLDPFDIGPAEKWRRAGRFLAIAVPVSWVVTLWFAWLVWPVLS